VGADLVAGSVGDFEAELDVAGDDAVAVVQDLAGDLLAVDAGARRRLQVGQQVEAALAFDGEMNAAEGIVVKTLFA